MNTPFSSFVVLHGSHKPTPPGKPAPGIRREDQIKVTLKLRPGESLPTLADPSMHTHGRALSREDFAARYGTKREDLDLVASYVKQAGLSVVKEEPHKRSVEVKGTIAQMEKAFRVTLAHYTDASGKIFRGRTGDVYIPEELTGIVMGVFGLDTRAIATPKIRRIKKRADAGVAAPRDTGNSPNAYTTPDIAKLYNFPTGSTGQGECIGIIELDGGYQTSDLGTYFQNLGLGNVNVVAVPVDDAQNNPGNGVSDSDGEVTLDIEVAGAVAPGATIAVYFGGNTSKGFQDAVSAAIHDTQNKPSVISISWGGPEDPTYGSYYTTFEQEFQAAATMGITVCVAAGDDGSSDGVNDGKVHVDYPASSAYVLGCGGTTLNANTQTDTISQETVWNEPSGGATGGGVSDIFPLPSFQSGVSVPVSPNTQRVGRGVPDIAGDADPSTGYSILLGGQTEPIGGTSAVAPLMAGLVALMNQKIGSPVGFINTTLYANPAVCRAITQGNNDTVGDGTHYEASNGWNPCAGNGVPDGTRLMGVLQSAVSQAAQAIY